ncbi:uncharacterized protein VDAG_04837 [Verticillium dahliae VdLs.17]|uniref:Homeobox and C2H2 transcription factor n=1 Tax=Verticillium dahliae (strain VdLs.17 / ATCC MYA-4575 / FGSC 10137) TaxID=498257 RepID=G2X352_VERDV|nr:uncharacterized protein VDAG_04837 [Verticillium dahliae VdLs.17]EGY23399.1 hypothetical protein VDAG_04837 [Verticillium dahliae VdLs.17]
MDSVADYPTIFSSFNQDDFPQHEPPIPEPHLLHHSSRDNHINQSSGESLPEDSSCVAWPSGIGEAAGLSFSAVPAKVGTRFSTRTLRILKTWFATHEHHPYPRTRDIESLQHQTGLNELQITTWLANARRRTKSKIPVRPTSPSVLSASNLRSMQIPPPQRPPPLEQLDLLRRWENSPLEEEAADATAILNAMSGSAGISEPRNGLTAAVRPQPSVWGEWSSASSAGTSNSNHSSGGSAYSQRSASSHLPSHNLGRWTKHKRRRNRAAVNAAATRTKLSQLPRKFQCTFCTETFAQKHGWQRHEKSLHLSLERWECSPEGPYTQDDAGHLTCAYCAEFEPDLDHLAMHNYEVCKNRPSEERSFYRKDHLRQHLKAVHHTKFESPTMGHWKQTIKDVTSSCGFCGLAMSSWTERVDHLADHFKSGATMAEWLGDWGFDINVVEMVQNSIPPYLIDFERNSPWPFTTNRGPPATPPSAFELIKIELDSLASLHDENANPPSQEDLQYESCCIISGSEMLSPSQDVSGKPPSWLRELLISDEDILRRAQNRPLGSNLKARVTELRINGKADIFDSCNLEEDLQAFVQLSQSQRLGSQIDDTDLQREACQIVENLDAQSKQSSVFFVTFLTSLIHSSTHWLESFRRRAGLSAMVANPGFGTSELVMTTSSTHRSPECAKPSTGILENPSIYTPNAALGSVTELTPGYDSPCYQGVEQKEPLTNLSGPQQFNFLSTDTFYWGLRRELSRFVAMTISPKNPQWHIPTDEELQCQARWIMFDSDDTWDQTPADNVEWLLQFKRDNGLTAECGDHAVES